MTPLREIIRPAEPLPMTTTVAEAVRRLVESDLPALPVVDANGKLAGTFGEREFFGALFPGYLKTLSGAGFVRRSLDEALERRGSCRSEPVSAHMYTERVKVPEDFSDAQVAETFLHHRTLIVPVVDKERRPTGVITRHDFMLVAAERFLARGS
jgi:CBS domain-containing protein